MTQEQQQLLIERLAAAHRPRHPTEVASHPVFFDLSEDAREQAFRLTQALRELESALDPDGLSSTAHAVLGRLPL